MQGRYFDVVYRFQLSAYRFIFFSFIFLFASQSSFSAVSVQFQGCWNMEILTGFIVIFDGIVTMSCAEGTAIVGQT